MPHLRIVAAAVFVAVFSITANAQSVAARTNTIVASFNKEKNVTKTKRGVTVSKYKKVTSVAAVRSNPADYSGRYEVEGLGFVFNLHVDASGNVTGDGAEPMDFAQDVMRTFTLRDTRIRGALFTGVRVYADGRTQPFEGAFINRTSYESPTDKGTTQFGLGLIEPGVDGVGASLERVFFEKR